MLPLIRYAITIFSPPDYFVFIFAMISPLRLHMLLMPPMPPAFAFATCRLFRLFADYAAPLRDYAVIIFFISLSLIFLPPSDMIAAF